MKSDTFFSQEMNRLVMTNSIMIEKRKGSAHPRYLNIIYPLDYGYLENTISGDSGGIDVWLGSIGNKTLTGILCTFDTLTECRMIIWTRGN